MSELFRPGLEVEQPPSLVRFNISRLVEVAPTVEAATKAAVTAVWRRHVNAPTSVNLAFHNIMVLTMPDGTPKLLDASYHKDTDTLSIALGSLQMHHPELPLEMASVLHAGHETRHKVQAFLGNEPPDYDHYHMTGEDYDNSPHEIEGWQSAIDAMTDVYPNTSISFTIGQHTYSNHQT
jgi:hypothetical protein